MTLRMLVAILALALLAGCDWSDLERIQHRAQINDRVTRNCVPEIDSFVQCRWKGGDLLCTLYTPRERRSPDEPHIEIRPPRVVLTWSEWKAAQ